MSTYRPSPRDMADMRDLVDYLGKFPTRYRHLLAAFGMGYYEDILNLEAHVQEFKAKVEVLILRS